MHMRADNITFQFQQLCRATLCQPDEVCVAGLRAIAEGYGAFDKHVALHLLRKQLLPLSSAMDFLFPSTPRSSTWPFADGGNGRKLLVPFSLGFVDPTMLCGFAVGLEFPPT